MYFHLLLLRFQWSEHASPAPVWRCSFSLLAQSEPAVITNTSADAPVAITGNATCSEKVENSQVASSASGELQFTNTSDQAIVAIEAFAAVRCMHSGQAINYHFDRLFFKAHGLPSGDSISHFIPDWNRESEPLPPSHPRVDVTIRFIQFEDGSTWGDSKLLAAVRIRRKHEEALLGRLASAPDHEGFDSILNAALANSEDNFVYSTAYKINALRKEAGEDAAIADVRDRVRVAEERESSGKF